MHNFRGWTEWSDTVPPSGATGTIEAEYVAENGRIACATVREYYYSDERGAQWGHSTGSYRDGDWKVHHPKYYRWRYTGPLLPSREAQGKSIIVWSFYDAPGELRALSNHGGDEDWIAVVPKDTEKPGWMESGGSFGCCDVSEHQLDDGRTAYIGAHA